MTVIHVSTTAVATPTITSLEKTGLSTVRVTWTPPQYPVTGYKVKYLASESGTSSIKTLGSDATSTNITGLKNEETYIFSVQAISQSSSVVSGVSEEMNITLGTTFFSPPQLTHSHKLCLCINILPPHFANVEFGTNRRSRLKMGGVVSKQAVVKQLKM